jgi:hypothetical protein
MSRKKKQPTDAQLVAAAKRMYHDEGTEEIDDGATVSRGDPDGAYVQAWVWVNFVEVTDEDREVAKP